jgi:5-hydroxyisourate hydrolase-like protein (transthyretin family)
MTPALLATLLLAPMPVEQPAPTFTVTVYFEGKPSPGVTVIPLGPWLGEDKPARAWPVVRTDAQGRVTLPAPEQLGTGIAWLFARNDHGRPGVLGLNHVSDPVLEPALRIDLAEVGVAAGRVVDADGRPVTGAKVRATQLAKENEVGGSVSVSALPDSVAERYRSTTGADGRFVIRDVPIRGRIGVTVSAPGYGTIDNAGWVQGQPCELRLGRAAKAHVRITGAKDAKQLAGMALRLGTVGSRDERPVVSIYRRIKVGDDGTATMEDLPPGRYGLSEDLIQLKPYRVKTSAEFEAVAGQTVEVTVAVEPNAEVRGRVLNKVTGAGAAGVGVALMAPYRGGTGPNILGGGATTDAEGRFVAYVPPESYWIDVNDPLINAPAPRFLPFWDRSGQPTPVTVGTLVTLPDVALEPIVPVEGDVVDETGRPLQGVRVFDSSGHPSVYKAAMTDAGGRFTLGALGANSRTTLRARTATATTDDAVALDTATQKGPVRLVLSPKSAARLSGRVLDADRKPVADAAVRVERLIRGPEYGQGTSLETYRTDATGRFETQALWPGDQYRVRASNDGSWGQSDLVRGVAGQVAEFGTIVLDKRMGGR